MTELEKALRDELEVVTRRRRMFEAADDILQGKKAAGTVTGYIGSNSNALLNRACAPSWLRRSFDSGVGEPNVTQTPYAILLAKPGDSDDVIRKLYHDIVRYCHPDALRGLPQDSQEKLRAQWYTATEAYTVVKTVAVRIAWEAQLRIAAGVCGKCRGYGVMGSRIGSGKICVCAACRGEGKIVKRFVCYNK
jgi:hypothetical protein